MAKPKGPLVFEAHSAALLLPASLILPGLKHSSRAPAHPAVQQRCSVRREQCRLCFRRLCSHTVAEHHAQRTRRVQRITPASSPATGAAGCEAAGSTSRAGREARGISAGGEPRCWGSGRLPCAQGPAQPPARPRSTRVPAAPPAPPERGSWGAGRGRSAARIGRKVVTKFFVRALIGRGLQGCDPAAYARSAGCLGAAERAGIGIRIGAVRGCGAGRDGMGRAGGQGPCEVGAGRAVVLQHGCRGGYRILDMGCDGATCDAAGGTPGPCPRSCPTRRVVKGLLLAALFSLQPFGSSVHSHSVPHNAPSFQPASLTAFPRCQQSPGQPGLRAQRGPRC